MLLWCGYCLLSWVTLINNVAMEKEMEKLMSRFRVAVLTISFLLPSTASAQLIQYDFEITGMLFGGGAPYGIVATSPRGTEKRA